MKSTRGKKETTQLPSLSSDCPLSVASKRKVPCGDPWVWRVTNAGAVSHPNTLLAWTSAESARIFMATSAGHPGDVNSSLWTPLGKAYPMLWTVRAGVAVVNGTDFRRGGGRHRGQSCSGHQKSPHAGRPVANLSSLHHSPHYQCRGTRTWGC